MRHLSLLTLIASLAAAQGIPGFSVANIDKTADPCVDFYQYACGTWMAKNPIPPDQSIWGQSSLLLEHNRAVLQNILEKAAVNKPSRTVVEQQIGDFYASCMDETAINKLGAQPLKPDLDRIAAIASKSGMLPELVRLHLEGVPVFFNFYSAPDAKDASVNLAQADQGGLGLPDRDYYLKEDAKSVEIRKEYVAHVAKMFELLGEPAAKAAADADAVMKIETALAKGALDRVSRRDPDKTYHKLSVHELVSMSPGIDWPKYFAGVGAPAITDLNVAEPNFFRTLESVMVQTNLEDLKTYLRWHLVHSEAALLSKPFDDENFHFFRQILTGAKEQQARWKRCVTAVDGDLGFALGQKYVEETFGPEGKARTLKMVQEIEKALQTDIGTLTWMTPATKEQALVKLRAVANKIGYPDKWRDYSSVKVVRGDAVGNDERATEFEVHRIMARIGHPVDHSEWLMTPPTVNAYYNPTQNNINFPAGILQPPFWDKKLDDAPNYGGVGAVVGHELTHGFDDQGRKFDPQGNLRDWWTAEDAKEFEKRAECFVKEYSSFIATGDVHLNGKLTLGENSADNGGLRLAFMALMESLKGKHPAKIDGYTPEQRFFLGWGQVWCQNVRPEVARMRAQIDPHSPGKDRVNGVVSNMPEFREAFACKVGQPMVREPACRVW
ncbi:MAG TPA: M13 family metallopeptidase [Bryobacteraceae bacterium]|nr:M13 family metallopeptidase [Bryobacteraceae bacterium]